MATAIKKGATTRVARYVAKRAGRRALETVLDTIVAKAVQLSGTDAGTIYVFDEAKGEFQLRATYGMSEELIASLSHPNLTNLSAENLAELKPLKRLSLAGSGLTNAGIKHLANLTNLEPLDLRRTKASAAGVAELQKALPKCKIERDGNKDK